MSEQILKVDCLRVRVEDKEILHGISLTVNEGETHVLMGPNGAGKSTLGYVLMGNPRYQVEEGTIWFKGKDITQESTDRRAKEGMFLSFQEPLEVPGLALESFVRNAVRTRQGGKLKLLEYRRSMKRALDVLQLPESYGERSLNVGFSGGEKKKSEILQLMVLKPSLAILDETDSGLDVDAVRLVSEGVQEYQRTQKGALLIITHSTRILEALHVDYTHVIVDGRLVATGDGSLVDEINRNGYESFLGLASQNQEA